MSSQIHLTRTFLLDFRMSGFILIKGSAVKFGMCCILMKKGNAMIRGFVFKIFHVLGFGKIQKRSERLFKLSPGPSLLFLTSNPWQVGNATLVLPAKSELPLSAASVS